MAAGIVRERHSGNKGGPTGGSYLMVIARLQLICLCLARRASGLSLKYRGRAPSPTRVAIAKTPAQMISGAFR